MATRLYQAGVEEQLIMERTGHRSIEGVRNYKRTCNGQREATSDVLNSKSGSAAPISPPSNQLTVSVNTQPQSSVTTPLSGQPMDTVPSAFNFHSCTVNITSKTEIMLSLQVTNTICCHVCNIVYL